jgi:predicted Na+-dependent transporter
MLGRKIKKLKNWLQNRHNLQLFRLRLAEDRQKTALYRAVLISHELSATGAPLMLLAAVFFVQYASTILENLGVLGLAAGALILLAMAGGSLLARLFRLRRAVRRTIVIEVGMQNAAQAIAVATSPLIFDSGEMAVPAIVYALVMNVVLLSYLKLLPKCTDETASEGA